MSNYDIFDGNLTAICGTSMKNLWTKRNIMDYLSLPEESLDKNYNPTRQKYRKALRKMDMETKAQGGVVDWNYILNDFMW